MRTLKPASDMTSGNPQIFMIQKGGFIYGNVKTSQ